MVCAGWEPTLPKPLSSKNGQRATVYEVAAAAKVHISTVSRALAGSPRISEATRARVQAAAAKLGFSPHASAQSLASGKSGFIAVVAPSLASSFAMEALRGIETAMLKSDYEIQVFPASRFTVHGVDTRELPKIYRRIIDGRMADAVISLSLNLYDPGLLKRMRAAQIPLVLVEGREPYGHRVCVDNVSGARQAVEHLIRSGRRRIALVSGNASISLSAAERLQGYRAALEAHGLPFVPARWRELKVHDDAQLAGRFMAEFERQKVDAVFCAAGDHFALEMASAAAALGLVIPRDLALVGFDDHPVAVGVGLSSVRQPIEAMGRRAFELALASIKDPKWKSESVLFEPRFIHRKTS